MTGPGHAPAATAQMPAKAVNTACWPFFHAWGKWQIVAEGVMRSERLGHRIVGRFIEQQRVCQVCGKTQIDSQRTHA